jgi:hypothetical protein
MVIAGEFGGGYEYPLTLLAGAVAVGLIGPGRYSLDALLSIAIPVGAAVALTVLTVLAIIAAMASRRPAAPPPAAPAVS